MNARTDDEMCSITTSVETSCSTDEDGKMRCETLRRKFRLCPGKPPEEIERTTEQTDGSEQPSLGSPHALFGGRIFGGGGLGGFGGGAPEDGRDGQRHSYRFSFGDSLLGPEMGMFRQLEDMMRHFDGAFGGGGGIGGSLNGAWPPPPPHDWRQQPQPDQQEQQPQQRWRPPPSWGWPSRAAPPPGAPPDDPSRRPPPRTEVRVDEI